MKITSIHQPSFFPWLGLLDKIAKSNHFVFLDHVYVSKGSFQYRNKFYCNDLSKFITLPVKIGLNIAIQDLTFTNKGWPEEHLEKLKNYYRKANCFDEIFPIIRNFYKKNRDNKPIEVIINSMKLSLELFNINVNCDYSSELNCSKNKGKLVFEICQKVKTDIYLSGSGAINYFDDSVKSLFEKAKIIIEWHDFKHPVYKQLSNKSFISGLSAIDILFFEGIDNARKIFWGNVVRNDKTDEK